MRVTNKMMTDSYLRDMNNNLNRISKINTQMATGKIINRVSDDPIKSAKSMSLTSSITANTQYKQNITDTINYLNTVDEALYQANNCVGRIRDLMISSGNAAYGSSEYNAVNEEISERVKELSQILNTSFEGKYIFGGTKTGSKPVSYTDEDGIISLTFADKDGNKIGLDASDATELKVLDNISSELSVEISQGVSIDYNVNAMEVLKFTNSKGEVVNSLEVLTDIQNNLKIGSEESRSNVLHDNLNAIDQLRENISTLRSSVGAKQQRMESAQSKNEDESANMTEILSSVEDTDYTEKSIEYYMAQTTYTAALQVSARVLPKTLLDYL